MNLHGKAAGVALAVLAACCCHAAAQDYYPLWENVPMDASVIPSVEGGEVMPPEEGGMTLSGMSMSVPESLDAEILALADALGAGSATAGEGAQAKAVRIFNWVRNNIDYEYYYGLKRGAALTVLEGVGNDFDQSALLADLLVAAGYPASDVRLRLRAQVVDYGSLEAWVGFGHEPYPNQSFQNAFGSPITTVFPNGWDNGVGDLVAKQAVFAAQFLTIRGAGFGGQTAARVYYPDFPGQASVAFNRMFVQLTVGGVTYDLDPSFKTYEKIVSSTDLAAVSGYDRPALLTAAGGSSDANSTWGLNQTNVGANLTARTTQLLARLNSDLAGLSVAQLANGRRIVRQDVTNLASAFPLPQRFLDTGMTFSSTADANLAGYKSVLSIQGGGLNFSRATSDLKGRKLSLTFSNNTAELRLDDGTPAATSNVTGASFVLTNTVTHPGGVVAQADKSTYRKERYCQKLCF